MWIRSQDKKVLKNCEEFYIYSQFKLGTLEIESYDIGSNGTLLGKYSTEVKALVVLNTIQNSIRGRGPHNLDGICDRLLGGVEFHDVFNMPKDEEVDKNEY